uniref:Survival Motor Neuron Gemin2-binding domain-containing protein n=1 Tax=Fagus sylvatica TaxID=28930 RepID=A0A2N9G3L5_FAGSY
MGKEGDLWDDSALINAFDTAISKYKIMHSKKSDETSTEGGKAAGSTGENTSANVNHDATRDANEKSNVASSTVIDSGETNNLSQVKENHCVDSRAPDIDSTDSLLKQDVQDAGKANSYYHGAEDYNKLLNMYYEFEEKRQNILEQLHQFGGWNYQHSGEGSGVQWGSCSTYQEHPIPASQVSHPNVVCSCCPYVCQGFVAPCTSCPGCSLGGTSVGKTCTDASMATVPASSCLLEDGSVVQTAMGAAGKALSSMTKKMSGDSNINEGYSLVGRRLGMSCRLRHPGSNPH